MHTREEEHREGGRQQRERGRARRERKSTAREEEKRAHFALLPVGVDPARLLVQAQQLLPLARPRRELIRLVLGGMRLGRTQ
eukprot:2227359-Rhodomonas_salina.1